MRTLVLGYLLVAGCSDSTDVPTTQLNLDRPIDIAFACYGGLRITNGDAPTIDQPLEITAQPYESCNQRSAPHDSSEPTPVPAGQESLTAQGGAPIPATNWYAFILQAEPGTVALARFETKPATAFAGADVVILDADPLMPGTNSITAGEDPVAIATDKSGCWELVANAGSCDLSAIEVGSALDNIPGANVHRIEIRNANGARLGARPAAMVIEPPGGDIGRVCPADPTGIVYVAYPGCHLVAAVDVRTATVVGGVRYDLAGTASILPPGEIAAVSCPAECGGRGTLVEGPRPLTLDLEEDPRAFSPARRLLIGAGESAALQLVELDLQTSMPLSVRPILLERSDPAARFGVTDVTIAPQIGVGGSNGFINDDLANAHYNFGYAITTDGTIRVVDLDNGRECDTQIDPRLLHDERDINRLACFPIGAASAQLRRPGARGPGIELVGDGIPSSIEIFRSPEIENDAALTGPTKLVGYFGIITATNGASYVLNVDDDDYADFANVSRPLDVNLPLAIAHQLRDSKESRELRAETEVDSERLPICETDGPDPDVSGGDIGGTRATTPPTTTIDTEAIASEKVVSLPSIRQVLCEGSDSTIPISELGFAAPDDVRDLEYPDLRTLNNEVWTLTWEGNLSATEAATDVDGPAIRTSQIVSDGGGMRLVDASNPFCDAGVEKFDIVQLLGCDRSLGDAQCPIGYTCFVHPQSEIADFGSCMLDDEAERLADACKDFLTSTRRYTVGRSASGALRLLARKRVLRATPLDGCTDDAQCEALGDYEIQQASAGHPIEVNTTLDPRRWACRIDTERAPTAVPGTGKRCVQICDDTSDCSSGTVCRPDENATGSVCMEGVIPPQACVNAPQRYELRAAEAFTVLGTVTGYLHATIRDAATSLCVKDPAGHPFEAGRIGLSPPACGTGADPSTGRLPDGSFEPNPCATTVDQTELAPAYTGDQCALASEATTLVTRPAPAIRFRNRGLTLTMVDPYYAGDARCIGDRQGTLGRVPTVFTDYQLSWRQTSGFSPLVLGIVPALPSKVLRGPTQSIWVIDEGDYLSTSTTTASTRGKVYRIEPQNLSVINVVQ